MKGIMKKAALLCLSLAAAAAALAGGVVSAAEVDSSVSLTPGKNNAYILFGDPVETNKLTFEDGLSKGITDSTNILYSEKFEMDGVSARRVYAGNTVFLHLDKSYYQPEDHRFLITITYYDFGPQVGYFYFEYNSSDQTIGDEANRARKRVTIEKPGITPKWSTTRIYVDDAAFAGKLDYGADMQLVTRTYNAFAKVEIINVDALERSNGSVEDLPVTNAAQAEGMRMLGLYDDKDSQGNTLGLEEKMTRIQALEATLTAIGYAGDIDAAQPTVTFDDVAGRDAKTVALAEKLGMVMPAEDKKFHPDQMGTPREVMTYYLRYLHVEDEDVYGHAYELASENRLILNTDFIMFPDNPITRDNFIAMAYNALTLENRAQGNVVLADLMSRGLVDADKLEETGVPQFAAYMYYVPRKVPKQTVRDKTSGRTYYYMNLEGASALRPYVSCQSWNYEGTKFLFGNDQTKAMYEYDTVNETVRFLDFAVVDTALNAAVTPDNLILYCRTDGIWKMNWETYEKEFVSPVQFTVLSPTNDGQYLTGYYAGGSHVGTIARLNTVTGKLDDYLYKNFYLENPNSQGVGHPNINPEYPELEFFCHEGTTTLIPDRLWLANWDTGEMYNMFVQAERSDGATGECSGHEVWGMDGEHMYWVKYSEAQNIGQNGLMRMDKYGKTREYINDDYRFWHCYPSGDDNWVAGDTNAGEIAIVNTNTYQSYLIAQFPIYNGNHPGQPHPVISRNGAVLSWQMIFNGDNVVCPAWTDITDLTGKPLEGGELPLSNHLKAIGYKGSDSEVNQEVMNGEECFVVPKDSNLFCRVDDDYLMSTNEDINVRVTYYDYGTQPVILKYSSAPKTKRDLANRENIQAVFSKTGSGRWKTVEYHLRQANLNNIGQHQSDFMLYSPYSKMVIKSIEIVD